ncbi:hypothetical protein, partial [Streptococcus pyogenes]
AKQMIDLKRNLFKIDVRAQKDEEKVFMRTAWAWVALDLTTCESNFIIESTICLIDNELFVQSNIQLFLLLISHSVY